MLDGVSVALEASQCVAIEGPSGGGKSTLLRHLTGLAWSPEANRRLDGEAYPGAKLPAWRSKVTLAAQDAPMIPGSIIDNLSFPFLQTAGCERSLDEARAERFMAAVGLGNLPADREVRKLSGGERHRLAMVRGLLWDPPVLVADEPLSGLDPEAAAASFDLLLDFAHRPGRLLLIVLHDPEMNSRADRHLHLEGGRLRGV